MNCPSCSSDNTQTIKMMCLSGTTTGTSTAVGVSSNLDVGVAAIGSHSQTNLAAQYNPGVKPNDGKGCGLFILSIVSFNVVIGLVILIQGTPGFFLFALLLGIPLGIYGFNMYQGKTQRAQIVTWVQKNKLFETGWICHKCGNTWNP